LTDVREAEPAPDRATAPEPPADARDLDRSLVRGVAWTGATKTFAQVFSWVTSIFVARLLSPDDYGIIGMAMVYVGITSLITEFGLSSAVVALRDLTSAQIAQLNSVAIILGTLAVVLSLFAAQPISWFFRSPEVAAVIMALSFMILIDSLRTVPAAVLARNMQFKFLAVTEAVKSVLVAAVTVTLAYVGMRYWALVVSVLLGAIVPTVLILLRHPIPLRIPRPRAMKEALDFTRNFLVTNVSWYAYSNADFAVAGRLLGQGPLGEYTFAWTLANSPAEKVVGVVNRVMPSVFSAVSHDKAALRRYLLRTTEAVALVVVPAGVGLALVSRDLVQVLLGEKWLGAVTPLTILGLYAAFHSLSVLVPPMLLAIGKVHVLARIVLVSACILPPAFVLGGLWWGIVGIAGAWITVYPLLTGVTYHVALRAIDLRWRDYASALSPAVSATAAMTLAVLSLQWFAPISAAPFRLAVSVALGALVYAACLQLFFGNRVRGVRASFQLLRAV
jgi:PST family polysaccharide transporter